MWPSLFRRLAKRNTPSRAPRIPAGQRVYAIGDIHGCDAEFAELLQLIDADHRRRGPADLTLILLGDLVDRGPDSLEVLNRAAALVAASAPLARVRWLLGNHEAAMLEALTGDEDRLRYFLRIGGDATVRSFWQDDAAYNAATMAEVAAAMPDLLGAAHKALFAAAEDMIAIGDYVFVHAGVRPGVPLDRQKLADLRWIREPFLGHRGDFGATIVHGHTITAAPEDIGNRIGIDTGAYMSGTLTALGLEEADRWFLQTGNGD